jgi:hypothetical protein
MFEMDNVDFVKLWKSTVESKGTWADFISAYREATDSEAKDESLKSSCSNRLNGIRKELLGRGISKEKVAEALPNLRRETKTKDFSGVIEFLKLEGQMETAE